MNWILLFRKKDTRLWVILEYLHHSDISRKPFYTLPFRFFQPTGRLMLVQHQFTLHDAAPITMHGKVEIGIVMFYGADMLLYRYIYIQFLTDFPTERFFGRFAWLNLASRKFPKSLEIPIPALGGEDLSVLMNDGCYYFYGFHE